MSQLTPDVVHWGVWKDHRLYALCGAGEIPQALSPDGALVTCDRCLMPPPDTQLPGSLPAPEDRPQ